MVGAGNASELQLLVYFEKPPASFPAWGHVVAAGSPLAGWAPSWTSSFLCCSLPALPLPSGLGPGSPHILLPAQVPRPLPGRGGGQAPRGPVGMSWSCVCNIEKVGDWSPPFQLRPCCCSLALRALRLRVGWSPLYSTHGSLLSHLGLLQRDTATRMLALAQQEGRRAGSPLAGGLAHLNSRPVGEAEALHSSVTTPETWESPSLPLSPLLFSEQSSDPGCPALNPTSLIY